MPPVYKWHAAAGERSDDDWHAHFQRGAEFLAAGEFAQAAGEFQRVLAVAPQTAEAHNNLGVALKRQKKYNEAGAAFQKAIAVRDDFIEAYVNLGDTLRLLNRLEEAKLCLKAALDIDPNCAAAHNNLGIVHRRLGESEAARECFHRALQLQPDDVDAANNLGNLLAAENQDAAAEEQFTQAVANDAQSLDAHNHLGLLRHRQGRLEEAEQEFQAAIELDPNYIHAHVNLGVLYQHQGRVKEAQQSARRALEIDPSFTTAHSNLLIALGYDADVSVEELYAEHQRWNQTHAAKLTPKQNHPHNPDPHRAIRVGYVSPDFRDHPVATFVEPLIRRHRRSKFEVVCYSDAPKADAKTELLRGLADRWQDVAALSDAELAAKIAEDRIDILVDLAGHTAGNRLLTFAQRPAPVQISMIGYGWTTGLETIDFRVTDETCDPAGETERHTEELLRVPSGHFAFCPPVEAPEVTRPPVLKNRFITFGSFNNLAKIGPPVIELWAEILKGIPNSRLMLKNAAFQDRGVCERYWGLLERRNVSRGRVIFRGYAETAADHLAAYNDVDIALDPFPYTGATTTCEALWMGVPVITLRGDSYVGRMSAGILSQAGYPHLIADMPLQYVSTAVGLGSDISQLEELRHGLRGRLQSSSLCETTAIVSEIESAYRDAWRRWCEAGC